MKTLLFTAFIGLISINSFAQNKGNSSCKNKVVSHNPAKVVRQAAAPEQVEQKSLPDYITVLPHIPNTYVAVPPAPQACREYRHNDIVVRECPGTFYDANGNIQVDRDGVWMGYYPKPSAGSQDNINSDIAPQHTVINNQKGVAPADGNSCNDCTPQ